MSESHAVTSDIKKERRDLYGGRVGRFDVVDVPPMRFLMADGHGDPNTSPSYRDVVEALYPLSYAVRALARAELGRVHTVGPLEGLWSADHAQAFVDRTKSAWDWTLMIVQPDWIGADLVESARERVAAKRLRALDRVRFEKYAQGSAEDRSDSAAHDPASVGRAARLVARSPDPTCHLIADPR